MAATIEGPAFRVGKVSLKPVQGDITLLKADALVQPSGTSQSDWPLQAAPWVIKADRDGSIVQALSLHAPLQLGDVVVTPPGPVLKAKYLLHAVVIDWAHQDSSGQLVVDNVVTSVAQNCVAIAAALGLRSIAFTPWGTRIGAIEPARVTALMVQAIARALQTDSGKIETVYLVSQNREHYQWFVDRTFVFRIVLDELAQVSDTVASLDIPDAARSKIRTALQNAQRNVVIYNEIFGGAKYNVSVEEGKGIVIGDQASVSLGETAASPGQMV